MSLWGNKFGTALCENGLVVLELCTKKFPSYSIPEEKLEFISREKYSNLDFEEVILRIE